MADTAVPKRLDYIDFMNIFACFGVVCLHCSGLVFQFSETRAWFVAMLQQTVFHFAVPVFFMITGTTLLEYRSRYSTKTFFKKRFTKTGIPFVFWSLFYLFVPMVLDKAPLPTFEAVRNAIFNNGASYIFWFFYVIFGIYLSMPVLSKLAKPENFRQIAYLCLLSYCFGGIFPCITRFLQPINGGIVPTIATGYLGYLFLGWLIRHESFSRKIRIAVYASGVLGALLMFFGTWWLSRKTGELDIFFMEYGSVACFPLSAAVMLFAKHCRWERVCKVIPKKTVRALSGASLGVYVLHMFFLNLVERIGVLATHPVYYMAIIPFAIYGVSVCAVLLLSKIPLIKYIVP
ncbi:MAG: acyltransferase [Candidatus Fimenecus sp.]